MDVGKACRKLLKRSKGSKGKKDATTTTEFGDSGENAVGSSPSSYDKAKARTAKKTIQNDGRVIDATHTNGVSSSSSPNAASFASLPLSERLASIHETLRSIRDESQLSSVDDYRACQTVYDDLNRILRQQTMDSALRYSLGGSSSERTSGGTSGSHSARGSSLLDGSRDSAIGMDASTAAHRTAAHYSKDNLPSYTNQFEGIDHNRFGSLQAENPSTWDTSEYVSQDFSKTFRALQREVLLADAAAARVLEDHPAATRPLSIETLRDNVQDFFVLDNSLRETTVGAPRGHTLEEKHKIVAALAKTSLQEIILGSYGSKISVCSQIAEQWKSLGQSFDKTWGFSDIYDFEAFEEDNLWINDGQNITQESKKPKKASSSSSSKTTKKAKRKSQEEKTADDIDEEYWTPEHQPKTTYDKGDSKLFKKASSGFRKNAFGMGTTLNRVLKKSCSESGRIPLGLLMMAGYGISNAILEVDTSVETFDYKKYNIVERIKFLMDWCRKHLPKRSSGEPTRILVNLRDFSNYYRSPGGLQNCLYLVDALCRLPPAQRPFGFMIEEPTGWLFPSEVGRTCRMLKLTMDRAGFPDAKFLIHCHWYFGLAEASQLQALANGANGVWAAVCKAGAQTGHACSTMTAVNLYRANIDYPICDHYNLEEMCEAARIITEVATRKPCDPHEEIYGTHAFDIPYFMISLPSCRYSIHKVLSKIGVKERAVRLNTLSMVSSIYYAMVFYFGDPATTGWNPEHCRKMHDAINNHLLTGLSRDYNSALGLGHLYGLVSREKLPWTMVCTMSSDCKIPDTHPVVMDFIYRWNRLCRLYETGTIEPHIASQSKSMMFWGVSAELEPVLESLPFEFYTADVMRNKVLEPIPNFFKLQVVNLLTNDERKIQNLKIPEVNFYEMVLRLKLFLEEADSLHVLGLVDDFCIRKNHDFFFGEDALWLKQINGERPTVATNVLLKQMQFYHKYYIDQGDTAISRCIVASAERIDEKRSVPADIRRVFDQNTNAKLIHEIADKHKGAHPSASHPSEDGFHEIKPSHEAMLRALAQDNGQDEELAQELSAEFRVESSAAASSSSSGGVDNDQVASVRSTDTSDWTGSEASAEFLAEEYIRYRKESLRVNDTDLLSTSELTTGNLTPPRRNSNDNGDHEDSSPQTERDEPPSPLQGVFGKRESIRIVHALRNQQLVEIPEADDDY